MTSKAPGEFVNSDWSSAPPPCTPPSGGSSDPPSVDVSKYRMLVADPNPLNGGNPPGGIVDQSNQIGTNNCIIPPAKITDSVKNTCLRSMVQATISADVTNKTNSLIQNIFGSSTTMNITFVDAPLSANIDGQSLLPANGVVKGTFNVTIQLDNTHLPAYSQQYIARVIMHEALHAYIVATNAVPATKAALQHEATMQHYVASMAASLQQMFPGLSSTDAQSLALGGLTDAPTFITTIETNLGLLGSFEATNLAYSIGTLGNRCN